jgi:hypothetical protein
MPHPLFSLMHFLFALSFRNREWNISYWKWSIACFRWVFPERNAAFPIFLIPFPIGNKASPIFFVVFPKGDATDLFALFHRL